MSNEINHNSATGLTFFAYRFQPNGNVFLSNGASDEVWGTGGRNASNYAVSMTEVGSSGHYVGDFDTAANITSAGLYPVAVCSQAGGSPADTDLPAAAQGKIDWNGSAEASITSIESFTDQIRTWLLGDWRPKSGVPGTYEILDPDDGVTPVMEATPTGDTGIMLVTIL